MTPAARVQAAITLLDEILAGKPAEQALTSWARASRFAGSKDRAAVRDHVFDALRCRRSFAALGGALSGRGLMLGLARSQDADLERLFDGSAYGPPPAQADETGRTPVHGAEIGNIPEWLWPEFERSLGAQAVAGADYLSHRAPVFVRVNTRRTSREALIDQLDTEAITATPHSLAPTALEITSGARKLRNTSAFNEGLFEMQDAASQAVVDALPLRHGQSVLDYCAGGGGKSLAMAASADLNLTAYDAEPRRMRDLAARAVRAGVLVRIVEAVTPGTDYDLVLCDVPCSGSGSWRRAPDGKWGLTAERLAQLNDTQNDILNAACRLVHPEGALAYVTCSVLRCENEDRVARFLEHHPAWQQVQQHRWPLSGGGDGFFLAVLRQTSDG